MTKTLFGFLTVSAWLVSISAGFAQTICISGSEANKHDVGYFAESANLSVSATGTVMIAWNFFTHPDGSLAAPIPPNEPFYTSAAAGATNYPTDAGGDGTNHLPGGGMNYSARVAGLNWPVAGKLTTDTFDADTIRFGALIGTFAEAPKRTDWFLIGFGSSLVVPRGGAHLCLLVNETWWGDNSGSYWVTISKDRSQSVDRRGDQKPAFSRSTPATSATVFSGIPLSDPLPNDKAFGYLLPAWIGLTHQIEVSSDLLRWEPLKNNALYFRDLDSTNFSARFYRFSEK